MIEELCALYRNRKPIILICGSLMLLCTSALYSYTHYNLLSHPTTSDGVIGHHLRHHYVHSSRSRQESEEPSQSSSIILSSLTNNDNLPAFPQADGGEVEPPAAGGIILFVHVPKTGGTTIRDNFSNATRFPQVRYKTAFSKREFAVIKDVIETRLDRAPYQQRNIMFIEVHGRNSPDLKEMAPLFRTWKQRAAAANVPFYVVTVLRNPIDFAVSFFNYFHVLGDDRFGPRPLEATNDNLQRTLLQNPQCLYLLKGEQAYMRRKRLYNVTQPDCHFIADLLQETMDWIGDTQHLTQQTLPLLTYWVTGSTRAATQLESSNVLASRNSNSTSSQNAAVEFLKREALDDATIQAIQSKTSLDQYMYERTVMSSWSSLSLQTIATTMSQS